MLEMSIINILKKFEGQEKSIREISKATGYHRETITKYLKGEDSGYHREIEYSSPVSDFARPLLESWYKEDLSGPRKQRRTGQKMYTDLLKEYKFKGSYATIKKLLQEIRGKYKEVFVPRENIPGEYIEFDFGYIKGWYEEELIELCIHCYQLIYSNDIFVYVSKRESQEEMFYSHKLAFKNFGGVPHKVRYDNLRQAVKRILRGKLREENYNFRCFREAYGFEAEFCERAKGWQKGDVEGLVGYVRRNYFSPIPKIKDLEEVNQNLSEWCRGLRNSRKVYGTDKLVGELYLLEKENLLPFKDIEVGKRSTGEVNHYSLVSIDSGFYSVPSEYAYKKVDVLVTSKEVIISNKKEEIARHKRTFEKGKQVFNPLHYLPVFLKKPYTVINSKPIRQLPEVFSKFFEYAYQKGYGTVKECIKVLELLREYSLEELKGAIEIAISYETYNSEGVKQILIQLTTTQPFIEKLVIAEDSHLKVTINNVDINRYNHLMQVGG